MFRSTYLPKIDKKLINEEVTTSRKNSIIQAIRRGFFSNIRYLLENAESDPNEIFEASSPQPKPSALEPVIINNYSCNETPIVTNLKLIIQSIYSFHGRTPLMFCASIENEKWSFGIAQNLLEKGAKLSLKDPNGLNALMYACIHSKESLVNLYLNALGDFHLLSVDNFGNTALHIASLGKNESICKILCDICVKYDINPLTAAHKNKLGHTPFDLCFLNRHKSCIDNYNNIKEHFLSRETNQTSARINTAFKKQGSISKTPSFLKNLMNHESALNHDSMQFDSSTNNLNDSSVLCENYETIENINKIASINTENNSDCPKPQYCAPFVNKPKTASYSNRTLNESAKPESIYLNSLEIYRNIYPYKEHLILINPAIKKLPLKEDNMTKLKPIFCELRPLTGSKSFLKSKINFTNILESNSEINSTISTKSILIKREKTDAYISNALNNSHDNLKSVSFSNMNSVVELKTDECHKPHLQNKSELSHKLENKSESINNDNWRKKFCLIFESLENHKSQSFRLGFKYSASTPDDLTAVHANALNALNNLSSKKSSFIQTDRRKSFMSSTSSVVNTRKTSISIES
jgi:hypothetical protein